MKTQQRLLYYVLVPVVGLAVLLLGAAALRTTLQIDKARRQAVVDATYSLANERVDRLDRFIVGQDDTLGEAVDVGTPQTLTTQWLATAARQTPTVRAVVVLDRETRDNEVIAFVSRRPGPDDDAFRRRLVHRLLSRMKLDQPPLEQLRHLHTEIDGRSELLSYWHRTGNGRRYLVVAWHYVDKLVAEVMPKLYPDVDAASRMNVVDARGRILFGEPLVAGNLTVGVNFPTTLYDWRLNVALTRAQGLEDKVIRQRYVQVLVVLLAMLIAVAGVAIIVRASIQERRLAALKSEFVANVSHELKTPLASVRMFGELLLTGRVANDAKRSEYLQIIVGESERLTALIDNVLDFARVERGQEGYEFAEEDVAEAALQAADTLRYRAGQAGIAFEVDLEPVRARCDLRALELAIINLLDNALKYAGGSSSVALRVFRDGQEVAIVVTDHGPGIPEADRERIFDRFARGRGANESRVRGSGIGLALVRRIAEAHGGHATVVSPVPGANTGSEFAIRFPIRG
ncbi:MAG: HAMP domain-containing sensor histidine kinase [Myxococcota bacterium]